MDNRVQAGQGAPMVGVRGVRRVHPQKRGAKSGIGENGRDGVQSRTVRQESIFEESRGETFKALLAAELEGIQEKVRPAGRHSGHPIYIGGATRKSVRALARKSARLAMRVHRNGERYARGLPAA